MYSVVCFHFRLDVFAFTEPWSRGLRLTGRGKAAKERKEKGGMMEGAREGGSEVRGVKARWREGGGERGWKASGTGNVRERGVK